jgi:hypothetical protein
LILFDSAKKSVNNNVMATKKRRGRPRKLTAKQLEMARRYESVWHYEFSQLAEYRQKRILNDPLGTSAAELAKKVARIAESDDSLDKLDSDDSLD